MSDREYPRPWLNIVLEISALWIYNKYKKEGIEDRIEKCKKELIEALKDEI